MHQKVFNQGGALKRELRLVKSGRYTLPASAFEKLAADPAVAHIALNRKVHTLGTGSIVPALDYHNETINSAAGWNQGLDGTGIGVAVIDSGIAAVDDLTQGKIVYSQDFTGLGSAADQYGHGTHVSGIIAGNGADSTGGANFYTFRGIAPGVNLVDLRVLDASGNGTIADLIDAIQTVIQLQGTYNIRVINMSLGSGVYESYTQDPLCQAVEQAYQAGIVVVVSAGNEGRNDAAGTNGYGTITSPGNDPYVITVGAMNTMNTPDPSDDIPASYSSKGPTLWDEVIKPDLVAPGWPLLSGHSFAGVEGKARFGGQRLNQLARVLVLRTQEEIPGGAALHDAAALHHRNALADRGYGEKIMRDIEDSHAELATQIREQAQDIGLGHDIKSAGRLVGDDQRRPMQDRHPDEHPLRLTYAEL
jgi:serine protease AprX